MNDPLLTAVAEALREHGVTDPSVVLDVADAAVRVLGRDRCTHSRAIHNQHHATSVEQCPYCAPGATPKPRKRGTDTVPTGYLL